MGDIIIEKGSDIVIEKIDRGVTIEGEGIDTAVEKKGPVIREMGLQGIAGDVNDLIPLIVALGGI